MSELYHKLGPQGRALLAQNGNGGGSTSIPSYQTTNSSTSNSNATPQELDYLINELRNPPLDITVNKILGYLYNYIPYIKHEHNLRVVIASFLNTPVCFDINRGLPEFENNYSIIEVFKLIVDKKLKISMPTLPIKTFYSILLKELKNFQAYNPNQNSWKILPILSGILLSNNLRNELYSEVNFIEYKIFFNDWDKEAMGLFITSLNYSISEIFPNNINFLSLISFALIYEKKTQENMIGTIFTNKIPHSIMINKLLEMIFYDPNVSTLIYQNFFQFNPNDPEIEKKIYDKIMNKPVIKHLNKLSFLLESYFTTLNFDPINEVLVRDNLIKITYFNKTLNHNTNKSIFNDFIKGSNQLNPLIKNFWFFMKSLLFSEIIIFQGILTRFVTANSKFYNGNFFLFGGQRRRNELSRIEYQYKDIALELIPNLYYINFILLSIGQGGFDNYNFVYYLTIELALSTGIRFEKNTLYLIGNYQEMNLNPDVLNNNYNYTSKIIFILGLWENYFQSSYRQPKFCQEVYNITIGLVDDKKYNNDELIEAAHSVLLFYFANNEIININDVLKYVELLLSQFPNRLSENQLNIAIETLGKKILLTLNDEKFLNFLVIKKCYIPLIQLIPYIQINKFVYWINKIHDLIGSNDNSKEENEIFWKVLTEKLDPNRTDLALYSFY